MPATYEPIATTTLGSAASSITFSSIPGTYTDLVLVTLLRENGGSNSPGSNMEVSVNNDSGTNYSWTRTFADGTGVSSSRFTSQAYMSIATAAGGATSSNIFGLSILNFFSYAGSTNKTILSSHGVDANGSGWVFNSVGLWRSTSTITSIKINNASGNNFAANSTATLYGILKA